jgi:translation initiation factor 1
VAQKKSGWSDDTGGAFNNPFAALRPDGEEPPPAPVAEPASPSDGDHLPSRAVVRVQKKGRRGKTVTLVTHLGLPPAELEGWCAALRRQLGCGGAVEGDALVLQGDQRSRVADALEARGVRQVTRS